MSEHHDSCGPSKLKQASLCPGSVALQERFPEVGPPSKHAARGTMLHEAMAELLGPGPFSVQEAAKKYELSDGDVDDVSRALEVFCDMRRDLPEREVETYLRLDQLGIRGGTGDVIEFESFGAGEVTDWKFGKAEVEHASTNLQTKAYALGLLYAKGCSPVTARIVQPAAACGGTQHKFELSELMSAEAEIKGIVEAARAPDAPRNPGREQCRYCSAFLMCPEACAETRQLAVVPDVNKLDLPSLARYMDMVPAVEALVSRLKEISYHVLTGNDEVDSLGQWKLKAGRNNKRWREEVTDSQVQAVIGEAVYAPAKRVSPAQALKAADKEGKKQLKDLIEIKPGSPRLVCE